MPKVRRKPELITTPAQLRVWRTELAATQSDVAELLGVTPRTLWAWESGENAMPVHLGWSLIAVAPHVTSLVAYKRRKQTQVRKRRAKKQRERRDVARRTAKRELQREAMSERRAEIAAQQKQLAKDTKALFKRGDNFIAKMEREGKIRAPFSPAPSFIKPPKPSAFMPKKLRSDLGERHHFRGSPGKRLRPEDIQYEEA